MPYVGSAPLARRRLAEMIDHLVAEAPAQRAAALEARRSRPRHTPGAVRTSVMAGTNAQAQTELDTLTRSERDALRALLVRATAAAGRARGERELDRFVRAAPVQPCRPRGTASSLRNRAPRARRRRRRSRRRARRRSTPCGSRRHCATCSVTGALGQIGRAFDDAGLAWVAMKGPVVAALLYPEVGDRSYGDLDLLVDRATSRGRCTSSRTSATSTRSTTGRSPRRCSPARSDVEPAVSVDLHWHLHYSREDRRPSRSTRRR